MKKIYAFLSVVLFIVTNPSNAQYATAYPTHWWAGMKWNKVQLLLHGTDAGFSAEKMSISYPGITLVKKNTFENGRYVALDLSISSAARPGTVKIVCDKNGVKHTIDWQLKARRNGNGTSFATGITSADFIYLLMPDRFSSGDNANDKFADMNDTAANRNDPFLRHGGDMQGIINHLDYLKDLGVTAIWPTPVVENNTALSDEGGTMRSSYHGYHFTDQYKVDRRFGGNEGYKKMIDAAHAKGIKIIQDAVYNHVGNKHFLWLDPPAKDWFNQWPSYTNTSYKDQPIMDPYASRRDLDKTVNGWFTPFLPDVNQRNPFMAKFLIQYALWAVEEFGIDGWRIDTYYYSDKNFLNEINTALYREYPHITQFGETLVGSVPELAYFAENNLNLPWKSNMQGVTDYEWRNKLYMALNEDFGWDGGVNRLYNTLVQDFLYKDPMRNEIYLDNHDENRFYSMVGENFGKYKMGITLLLTQRGIPQLYYGTEVLMKNFKDPSDAEVRRDFPGGWAGDSVNKFDEGGRTELENVAFNYVRTLAQFRKKSSAIKTGKFMQYLPVDGVYVYFRYDDKQTVISVINTSAKDVRINMGDYAERTTGFTKARDVETNNTLDNGFVVTAKSCVVAELVK